MFSSIFQSRIIRKIQTPNILQIQKAQKTNGKSLKKTPPPLQHQPCFHMEKEQIIENNIYFLKNQLESNKRLK